MILNILAYYSQVKKIMEESVTRKFVHEESSIIIALCGKSIIIMSVGAEFMNSC